MKTTFRFAFVAAALGMLPAASMAEVDCVKLAVSVKNAVAAKPADVLKIVESEVSANSDCACEVVKAAIQASEANSKTIAAIVETAASAAPDKMRLVAQCAVAVAPDALVDVQNVMARLDPNKGETSYSSKSSKSPKTPIETAPDWNPLDFPGKGPVGYIPGGPPPRYVPFVPPVIDTWLDSDLSDLRTPPPSVE